MTLCGKIIALCLVLALTLGVMAPPSLAAAVAAQESPSIGKLDVCHPASPALSAGGAMPCVIESVCCTVPFLVTLMEYPDKLLFSASLIPSGNEEPPRS